MTGTGGCVHIEKEPIVIMFSLILQLKGIAQLRSPQAEGRYLLHTQVEACHTL